MNQKSLDKVNELKVILADYAVEVVKLPEQIYQEEANNLVNETANKIINLLEK